MATIERRVSELERTGTSEMSALVLFVEDTAPDPTQQAAVQEAERAGRLVIRLRFVQPERATKEQEP